MRYIVGKLKSNTFTWVLYSQKHNVMIKNCVKAWLTVKKQNDLNSINSQEQKKKVIKSIVIFHGGRTICNVNYDRIEREVV